MRKTFSELVIDGHFVLVKGFLLGHWSSQDPQPQYFFHRNTGIHHETFKDLLAKLFELEDQVPLCLEDGAVPAFQQAVDRANPIIGISVKSVRQIETGDFEFSFHIYNRQIGEECQSIFSNLPEEVQLIEFEPEETIREEGKGDPRLHAYEYEGKGIARGDFGGVKDLYLTCKKSTASPFITTGEIKLNLKL